MGDYCNKNNCSNMQHSNRMMQSCRTSDATMNSCRRSDAVTNSCRRDASCMNSCKRNDAIVNRCRREERVESCCDRRNPVGQCCERDRREEACCVKENPVKPCCEREQKQCCEREDRGNNRNVEIKCVCQVTENCHRKDRMEKLGCEFPVVMAYVPWQQWGEQYEAECGLKQGTIFKDLNYIFCGERC